MRFTRKQVNEEAAKAARNALARERAMHVRGEWAMFWLGVICGWGGGYMGSAYGEVWARWWVDIARALGIG